MKLSKKIQLILLFLFAGGTFYLEKNRYIIKKIYPPGEIHARIVNGVKNPGIYSLEEGGTLGELIEKAGGISGDISVSESDLDRILEQGEIIDIGVVNGGKQATK